MPNNVSYGYLRPLDSRFSDLRFRFTCGNEVVESDVASDERLVTDFPNWGRGNDIQATTEFNVDLDSVIDDCDLPLAGSQLGTLLRWRCPSTSIRGSGELIKIDNGTCRVSVAIPGSEISGSVIVELTVVLLTNPVDDERSVAPFRPGSVLWTMESRLYLEGVGATIQTVPYNFSEASERDPMAMWRISMEPDLDLHVTRAVRVCLNTGNRLTKVALDNLNSGKKLTREVQMWQRFLEIDLRTHLLWAALGLFQENDLSEYEDDDESYGQLLFGFYRTYFGDDDPRMMMQKAAVEPSIVAARVQNYYGTGSLDK